MFFLIFEALLLPTLAMSQESSPGFHEHDGFYLSLSTGVGGASYHSTVSGCCTGKATGGAGIFDLKVGGSIIRDQMILSGDWIGIRMQNPKYTYNASGVYEPTVLDNEDMTLLGLGITHYFTFSNVFLNGTFGAGQFIQGSGHITTLNDSTYYFGNVKSDYGFGFQVKCGKEWWVSKDWGLGISAFLFHLDVSDKAFPNTIRNGSSFGILFNSTFN